jgi:hypothetical protein
MVLSFDVIPYYVDGFELKCIAKTAAKMNVEIIWFICCINYLPFLGQFAYPFGNGKYEIVVRGGELSVTVNTRGQGSCYTHPLRHLLCADVSIQIGWCTINYLQSAKPWQFIRSFPMNNVRRFSNKSILSNWLSKRGDNNWRGYEPFNDQDLKYIYEQQLDYLSYE